MELGSAKLGPVHGGCERLGAGMRSQDEAPFVVALAPRSLNSRSTLLKGLNDVPQNSYFLKRAFAFLTGRLRGLGLA